MLTSDIGKAERSSSQLDTHQVSLLPETSRVSTAHSQWARDQHRPRQNPEDNWMPSSKGCEWSQNHPRGFSAIKDNSFLFLVRQQSPWSSWQKRLDLYSGTRSRKRHSKTWKRCWDKLQSWCTHRPGESLCWTQPPVRKGLALSHLKSRMDRRKLNPLGARCRLKQSATAAYLDGSC